MFAQPKVVIRKGIIREGEEESAVSNTLPQIQDSNCMTHGVPSYSGSPAVNLTELETYSYKKNIDASVKSAEKYNALNMKKELIDYAELKKQRKVLYTNELYFNTAGELTHIIRDPDKEIIGGTVICYCRGLKLVECVSYKGEEEYSAYILEYSNSKSQGFIVFRSENFTGQKLLKEMSKAGIHVSLNRETKEDITNLLLNLLKQNMGTTEIPFSTGWNLMKTGWEWCDSDAVNYMEVIKNAR